MVTKLCYIEKTKMLERLIEYLDAVEDDLAASEKEIKEAKANLYIAEKACDEINTIRWWDRLSKLQVEKNELLKHRNFLNSQFAKLPGKTVKATFMTYQSYP
jgi:hypothetical protein